MSTSIPINDDSSFQNFLDAINFEDELDQQTQSNLLWLCSDLSKQLVIPFVGAGLSRGFGYPTWSEFLLEQAKKCDSELMISELMSNNLYEEAAEILQQRLGIRAFLDVIDQSFGDRDLRLHEAGEAVLLLPYISDGPVITTNYDHVLESVFEYAGRQLRTVWGTKPQIFRTAIRNFQSYLLKIHGDAADSGDRILTKADYHRHYEPDQSTHAVPNLGRILLETFPKNSMLFIGCSLSADRSLKLLRDTAAMGIPHYAIVEAPRTPAERQARSSFLSDCGIRPIWYPNARHKSVASILSLLILSRGSASDFSMLLKQLIKSWQAEPEDTAHINAMEASGRYLQRNPKDQLARRLTIAALATALCRDYLSQGDFDGLLSWINGILRLEHSSHNILLFMRSIAHLGKGDGRLALLDLTQFRLIIEARPPKSKENEEEKREMLLATDLFTAVAKSLLRDFKGAEESLQVFYDCVDPEDGELYMLVSFLDRALLYASRDKDWALSRLSLRIKDNIKSSKAQELYNEIKSGGAVRFFLLGHSARLMLRSTHLLAKAGLLGWVLKLGSDDNLTNASVSPTNIYTESEILKKLKAKESK